MEALPLHSFNQENGAVFAELKGRELVARYGPLNEEYAAARSAAAIMDTAFRELFRLTGEDRVEFLHGMVTNDIKGLPVGSATYAALLTPKGGMVTDARILRREEELLLQVEPGFGSKLREFLERYVVSEDVALSSVSAEYGAFALAGPQSAQALEQALGAHALPGTTSTQVPFDGQSVCVLREDTWGETGFSLWVPQPAAAALARRLIKETRVGTRWIGFEASEVLRVEAGIPRFGADMDEDTLALEANIDHAIHFNKGCYIGQEVIARATYRGHVNRKLAGFVLGEHVPAPRADLLREGKKVGWLTSAVFSPGQNRAIALGYLHRDLLEVGTRLDVAGYPDGATVRGLPARPSMPRP